MGLQLYNTLTRKKQPFEPLEKGRVGIYVCGPTVYGHAHLGHAKSYISFDILVRYLRYLGYAVTYVQNITDVGHLTDNADEGEDKIIVAARREKKHPMAIAEYYTKSYFEDMDRLNCLRPDISPRASGHIPEQIELVEKLLEKGYAYEVNGSVYFDVSKFRDYGKLSGRNVEEMLAGARVEVSQEKKHPADFALWKKAEPNHIMQWRSPWGMGYPGWHLECSVMSTKYLGQPFDIHGGGIENQFPHHECEIAQSQAANDVQFVRYWLHNNMVTVDGQKMGKSLYNFITLKEAFAGEHERLSRAYEPLAIRQLVLNSHYRSPLDFSDAALHAAQSGYNKINRTVKALRKELAKRKKIANTNKLDKPDDNTTNQLKQLEKKFKDAMNDDLNTAVALSVIFDIVQIANSLLENSSTTIETLQAVDWFLTTLGGNCLGIVTGESALGEQLITTTKAVDKIIDELMEILIKLRNDARQQKDFAAADRLRDLLDKNGIVLEDKPGETVWRFK